MKRAMLSLERRIRAIAAGDRGAFSALYRHVQPQLVRYATGLLAGDRSAAEDVVDEAMLALWRDAARYSGAGSAIGWLRRIVRNKAVDWLRHNGSAAAAIAGGEELWAGIADTAPGPCAIAEHRSERALLHAALDQLSLEHREAVWLCYFEELSLAEIAEIAGCPVNTVKTRLFNARRILRDCGMLDRAG